MDPLSCDRVQFLIFNEKGVINGYIQNKHNIFGKMVRVTQSIVIHVVQFFVLNG